MASGFFPVGISLVCLTGPERAGNGQN